MKPSHAAYLSVTVIGTAAAACGDARPNPWTVDEGISVGDSGSTACRVATIERVEVDAPPGHFDALLSFTVDTSGDPHILSSIDPYTMSYATRSAGVWQREDFYHSRAQIARHGDAIYVLAQSDPADGPPGRARVVLLVRDATAEEWSELASWPGSFLGEYSGVQRVFAISQDGSFRATFWSFDDRPVLQIVEGAIDSPSEAKTTVVGSWQFEPSPWGQWLLTQDSAEIGFFNGSNVSQGVQAHDPRSGATVDIASETQVVGRVLIAAKKGATSRGQTPPQRASLQSPRSRSKSRVNPPAAC